MHACVAEQQKHLTVNQASNDFVRCESYHMHQEFLGRRLNRQTIGFQTRDSRFKSGRPSQIWKVARGGAQLVLKTRPSNTCRGFDSFTFRQDVRTVCEIGRAVFGRRRLTVWQRFAKSPRIACAGSSPAASAKVSAVRSSDSTGGCQRSSLTAGRIRGPVAQRNESATLRRSRSHVQIVPGPPN